MNFQWSVSKDYSSYSVTWEGQDWIVVSLKTETYFSFALYDGDLNFVHELPAKGGLYLALDVAQGIITKEIPESLASVTKS